MPNRFMQFFGQDSPGSSGSAAVDTTIVPDGEIDPLNYVPPNEVAIQDFLEAGDDAKPPTGTSKAPADVKPKADDPTKVVGEDDAAKKAADEKKAADDAAAAKKAADEKPEPAAKLRERLKTLETENSTLKTQLETAKTDKRVEELQAKIAENEKKTAEVEKQKVAAEKRLEAFNPHVNKRLVEMRGKFNESFAEVLESVPSLKGDYQRLLDEYQKLPHGKDDYAEKLGEFKKGLREKFGDDSQSAFDMIRKGLQFRREYAKASEEVAKDSGRLLFEEDKARWDTAHGKLETNYDKFFEPPADAATADPFNTKLFLKNFETEAIEPAEAKRVNTSIKNWVDTVFNGAAPRTAADFPGMSEEQAQAEIQKINARTDELREAAPEVVAVCMKFAAYGRALIAQNAQLKERLAAKNSAAPPDPTGKDGVTKKKDGDSGDSAVDALNIEFPSAEEIEAATR